MGSIEERLMVPQVYSEVSQGRFKCHVLLVTLSVDYFDDKYMGERRSFSQILYLLVGDCK